STPTDTGNLTTHAFASVGSYNVVLTVTDNESFTNRTIQTVVVQSAPPGPQPPIARFTVTPTPVDRGVAVTFNASSSIDPDGDILTYIWRVNGTVVGNTNAFNFSGTPGGYVVNVTVSDGSLSASREWTVTVRTVVVGPSPLFSGIWPYAVLAVIVLGAILLIVLVRRRRKPEEPRLPPT